MVELDFEVFFSPVKRSFLKSSTSYCLTGVSLTPDGLLSVIDRTELDNS